MGLEGQVAIITGGSRGIGLAIRKALAANGVAVALVSRSQEAVQAAAKSIQMSGTPAIGLSADVTDRNAVISMVAETVQQLGPVDLLVNNAGSANALGPVWEVSPDAWWRDVTTRSPAARQWLPEVKRTDGIQREGRYILRLCE